MSLRKILHGLSISIAIVFVFLASFILASLDYKNKFFGDTSIEELIFHALNGLEGTNTAGYYDSALSSLPIFFIILFLLMFPMVDLYKDRVLVTLRVFKKQWSISASKLVRKMRLFYGAGILSIALVMGMQSLGAFSYISSITQKSTFIEDNYVDPRQVAIVAPEKKRNLIYIYLESMENTLASVANGGTRQTSLIPELEVLALDESNVSFSNGNLLGGARQITGAGWTVASMTAQSAGLPLSAPKTVGANDMDKLSRFLPGAYSLGDVLQEQGYNQQLMVGSDAGFGGRDKLYKQHGDFEIFDYSEARKRGKIPQDYYVWWGYEDKKLYEFAKEEISRLAQSEAPFNFQMLTVDTHFLDGYNDETCPRLFDRQYDNVYACASKQLDDFLQWAKQQEFYENTTVVIVGDHLGMQAGYYDEMVGDKAYDRTNYNVILNSAVKPVSTKNRNFTALDMYPTTLVAMGYTIDGDRLALGTNLFSDDQTLVERFGLDYVNNELSKNSPFYYNSILFNKSVNQSTE